MPTGFVGDPGDAGLPATGLSLWLRADHGVATLDGGAVCRWDDVSGNARSFVPGTNTPPALDPVGTSSAATCWASRPRPGGPSRSTRAPSTRRIGSSTSCRGLRAPRGTTSPSTPTRSTPRAAWRAAYTTGNAFDSTIATTTNPRSHVLSISSMVPGGALPGVLVYSVDGVVTTLSANPGSAGVGVEDFSSASTSWIGVTTPVFSGTEVGEILVYDHALTALERTAVEQYFLAHFP